MHYVYVLLQTSEKNKIGDSLVSDLNNEIENITASMDARQVVSEEFITEKYEKKQAGLLYQSAGLALAAIVSSSSLVAYYFYSHTDTSTLMTWYAVLLIVSMLRYTLVGVYHAGFLDYSDRFWVRAFEIGTASSGLVWGSAAIFILPPDSFSHHVMLAFVFAGLCAGSVAIYTVSRFASSSFTILTMLPLIYSLHIIDESLALPMEVLVLMYMMSMLAVMARLYSAKQESMMLDIHNRGLVDYLSNSLNEMDGLNLLLQDEFDNRKVAEDELSQKKELAEVTLASLGDGVITTNSNGDIDYMNPVAESLTCHAIDDVRGLPVDEVLTLFNESAGEIYHDVTEKVIENQARELSGRHTALIREDGRSLPIVFTCSPMRNNRKEIIGSVIIFRDISELRQLEDKLSFQASHDFLTGLINRREFECRLSKRIKQAALSGKQHALMYLDLDQFKVVNDTCGHAAGDELLKQISNCMPDYLRQSDSFARLGGDEFGVLLENCPLDKAKHIAETLRDAISKIQFTWDNKVFASSVSIGVVPITATSNSLADLMRSVDSACYIAKDMGRNRVHVLSEDDTAVADRYGELQWVHGIKKAIKEDRIVLFVQRILPLNPEYTDIHYEILMRMQGEDGKLVPPMEYIPAAEHYDLMPALDRHVASKAFGYINRLLKNDTGSTIFSINLSGHSFCDEHFLDNLVTELNKSNVPPKNICFEVTETAAIGNLHQAQRFMSVLRDMGCQFSLDDFGSGLSSFAYLKNLDVNYLKIDGIFIKDIATDKVDAAMVQSINQVGQILGMKTIAEFVENDEIVDKLKEIGVDYVQGYGIEKPHPFEDLFINE
ncbi:MAG: EAL domain-containing protein [Sulfuriflexus sp.]|nr:EAL domain-containing protein [Sulfuriflexus sp.]